MTQNTASDPQTAPSADPFAVSVYGMPRDEWNAYGEQGRTCPEWCSHGGTCAHARAELYAFEAQAEGAAVRAAEAGLDDELEREAAAGLSPARVAWDRWYGMEDSRPADRESPEYAAWAARCAELHVEAIALDTPIHRAANA